jgi:Zn finger protein HypA/HybF involved in hydrogenase expression
MAGRKRTIEEVTALLSAQDVIIVSTFIDSHTPVTLRCEKHEHTWTATIANVARYAVICPVCRKEHLSELGKKTKGRLRYSTSEIDARLNTADLKRISPFTGIGQPISVSHSCGHAWSQRAYDLLQRLYCPSCQLGVVKLTPKQYTTKVKSLHPNIRLKTPFQSMLTDVTFRCSLHKRDFTTIARNLIRGAGCPLCANTHKIIDDASGRRLLRGREPQALAWLLANTSLKAKDIQTKDLPVLRYSFAGKQRRYYPDMLTDNKLIEVKSLESAGLSNSKFFYKGAELFDMLKAKASAARKAGYDFRLLIMSADGRRVRIPKNWQTLDRKTVMEKLCQ